jgi:hypothetical protein
MAFFYLLFVPPPFTRQEGDLNGFEVSFASFENLIILGESKAFVTYR